ncbi:phage tail sheath family protein [uncultured Ruminococcus sp.]|uniref:phage tail sheath family protein n=1 Tax=uncultured Ruminococcus sp. TaxID=165186 RepID=UPI0025F775E9|nr:phage tail sheath family protein [uncultured Ruminococcus sp.]
MAGGKFDKVAGKVRPGNYINFESTKTNTLGTSARGIVVIPLIGHTYGPAGEFIVLTKGAPDVARAKLGYSIYDDNANMLLIREAFKNAATVIVYIVKAGTKATGVGGGLKATAKYGGTRGNALAFSVVANPVSGFDVTVSLAGETMSVYEGISSIAALVEVEDNYLTFEAVNDEATLAAVAGVTLTGGTDAENSNADVTAFLDAVEGVSFNALAFPITDEALKAACKSKIKYLRETIGKTVVGVVADYNADYEGIINVTNSVKVDSVSLTNAQATAWVAGAQAGASYTESNTYKAYEGAEAIVGVKTHEQAVAAVNNGEFFFSYSEQGEVVVEYDINSLVTISDGKDASYRKNRVIRVFDTFAENIHLNFAPNKYPNSDEGWEIMEGVGRSIIKAFADAGAITDVDLDNDFSVDREMSSGDQTFFNAGLKPLDSAEKLYFSVATR